MSKFQIAKGLLENLPDDYTEGKVYFIYDNVNSENLDIYADIDGVRRKINTIYTLPPATTDTLGGVKVGDGLSVAVDGTLSSDIDTGMVVLEYGVSTWADFQAAYEANRVVYCLVRHASGYRMAFLAYVDTTQQLRPGAEFQYYRSMSSYTDTQQGDEVYVYHLSTNGTWTTTVRQAYTQIVAGDGLKSTYAGGALTLSNDAIYELPPATTDTLGGVKVGDGLSVAADGTLSANDIADGSVTTDKLADGAVTDAKLAQDVREAISISSAADALMVDPSESTWSRRTSTGSGMARVESVQGAAVAWNQRFSIANGNINSNQGTKSFDSSTGIWTITSTQADTNAFGFYSLGAAIRGAIGGHKTLVRAKVKLSTAGTVSFGVDSDRKSLAVASDTFTTISNVVTPANNNNINCYTNGAEGLTMQVKEIESFDLTQMFGAGNEPNSVAEFEAMFPEPYYPYSAPTLKPVQIAGIRSTGRNLIDLNSPYGNGIYNAEVGYQIVSGNPTATLSGENPCAIAVHSAWNGVMFVSERLTVGNAYRLAFTVSGDGYRVTMYTLDANHVIARRLGNYTTETQITSNITVKSNESYIALSVSANVANTVFLTNTMLQLATADFNTYKPYTTDSVEWETQTLRAAGSVRDELTAGELVTRVGVVDLGTLNWTVDTSLTYPIFRTSGPSGMLVATTAGQRYIECAGLNTHSSVTRGWLGDSSPDKCICQVYGQGANFRIGARDSSYTDPADFKAAMSGVMLYYVLATPTTITISPALPMTYWVEQGGTESIIVPAGEISVAPVITVAEGESAADVVMDALACIATPDGPVATANHAANTYLTMQGKLYKVTAAIAAGESIIAGTNVTETTVMDGTRMVVLEYGKSTWNDFLAAYNTNKLVYCRVPVGSTGQRMAFLAYVSGNVTTPTFAEFQYYRSMEVSKYSATQQGDEVYVYTLRPNNNTWTTVVRQAYVRIATGTGLSSVYSNGTLTLSNDYAIASNTPTANYISKYDNSAYLYSTTPSANDNSTKVATTAYVDNAIPKVYSSTNTSGYLTMATLPIYDGTVV